MAWLRGKVALGSFPDLAGAVNKISESVKNIEKNFDNALGLEDQPGGSTSAIDEKDESSTHPSSSKQKEGIDVKDSTNITEEHISPVSEEISQLEEHQHHPVETNIAIPEEVDNSGEKAIDTNTVICKQADGILGLPEEEENIAKKHIEIDTAASSIADNHLEAEANSQAKSSTNDAEDQSDSLEHVQDSESSEIGSTKNLGSIDQLTDSVDEVQTISPDLQKSDHELNVQNTVTTQEDDLVEGVDATYDGQSAIESEPHEMIKTVQKGQPHLLPKNASEKVPEVVPKDNNENAKVNTVNQLVGGDERDEKEHHTISGSRLSDNEDSIVEVETLKSEMKKMEDALLGAARQAQAKADEISKLMNENEQLKFIIEDQKKKSNEAGMESLREECHQRVSTLERKVYALTRERDTLRREQNKRSDATALLKEKDDIITQVMEEGEKLSKKQAVQESTIRKLRAQIREFEDEKKGFISKLQAEENKVESLKSNKAATEKLLQETREKNQSELETQKEYYLNALSVAKEAKAVAEARVNDEVRTELEIRLKEAGEREFMLIQTLEELRQTLCRKEQQEIYREDMLRREIDDLQKRYQASEHRCEELVMQVPESTRPLLRQIEAMQETTARKLEAWAAVERSLNIRLQDAEAKAKALEEKNRAVNERLSQTLSRINVLEAQISCLRSEQTQLTRSLEKERQRASESRQEYLVLKEEADTHNCHASQLEEEMRLLKKKHKRELQEALTQRELLQQEIEREKAARLELEKTPRLQVPTSIAKTKSIPENGERLTRRLSSPSSLSSMEESLFLQASLDSSYTFSERSPREPTKPPFYFKSMSTPNVFHAALRQKEGELQSYMSRLVSMESIRDSLSEELVKMTKECEKLRSEVALLPSIKAELEALRIRHSAALELMGERDEELEELRADIVDVKEMYREQVNMLVNKV
ncbi:golgin candidate 5 [Lactuca sativa]|uniref:golgin candidate 5 n=1 Tax=Lactuca sativa TaxID=4236 RepID=UPI000CD861BF|nr:golgin candidate 5 [Lactuca sativa]